MERLTEESLPYTDEPEKGTSSPWNLSATKQFLLTAWCGAFQHKSALKRCLGVQVMEFQISHNLLKSCSLPSTSASRCPRRSVGGAPCPLLGLPGPGLTQPSSPASPLLLAGPRPDPRPCSRHWEVYAALPHASPSPADWSRGEMPSGRAPGGAEIPTSSAGPRDPSDATPITHTGLAPPSTAERVVPCTAQAGSARGSGSHRAPRRPRPPGSSWLPGDEEPRGAGGARGGQLRHG